MKVCILPRFSGEDQGDGGIRRVVEQQVRWLPEYGIEVVEHQDEADVVASHAMYISHHPRVVHHNHGLYWVDDPVDKQTINWPLWAIKANKIITRAMITAQAVTAPSEWVANAIRRGTLIDPVVVHHGVNLDEWEPGVSGGYVLWNKNRTDPICTPAPLNRLAALVPKQQFVSTFGDPAPNVRLVGKQPYERMKELVRRAGVYLATTRETGGVGTLEAMAAGVPVLGYDFGGTSDFVTHLETGYLVEPGDEAGLVEGLAYCLAHRERLGAAGRERVRSDFQWQDRVGDYARIYRQVAQPFEGPKVSVIITAYNLESFLEAAIRSVVDQTFQDWELIIVDDHSPDRCGEIADGWAERDSRITVIHNPTNLYLSEARNRGIQAARGQYILCLDADDRLDRRALGALAGALDQDQRVDIVTGQMAVVEPDGKAWVSPWPPTKPSYEEQIKRHNQLPYAAMYRRWVWERTGGYRRRWRTAEDAEFWTRAMSYGAQAAHVVSHPTLIYSNRPGSMSHSESEKDWTRWFTWARHPHLTPFGAATREMTPVFSYDPPRLSVVIPVGPGHEWYLPDALDSLVAQTFRKWEVIVVNDTGVPWGHIPGFPFARLLDSEGPPQGAAAARNRGIAAARCPLFVLLDADDIAQPLLLERLLQAQREMGGWVYTDWYDQEGKHKQAQSFDPKRVLKKMPGPITGLYPKAAWERVGGFDETFTSWEDWDFQISLTGAGFLGHRLPEPLFIYRYQTGTLRERGWDGRRDLVERIYHKHRETYDRAKLVLALGTQPLK